MANVDDVVLEGVYVGQVVTIQSGGAADNKREYCIVTDVVEAEAGMERWRLRRWFGDCIDKYDHETQFRHAWPIPRILLLSLSQPVYYILPNSRIALSHHGLLRIRPPHLRS